jgi:hypothetical protein
MSTTQIARVLIRKYEDVTRFIDLSKVNNVYEITIVTMKIGEPTKVVHHADSPVASRGAAIIHYNRIVEAWGGEIK